MSPHEQTSQDLWSWTHNTERMGGCLPEMPEVHTLAASCIFLVHDKWGNPFLPKTKAVTGLKKTAMVEGGNKPP